ncbi:M48 family metallopeptidase [Opitutus terrae]|uniref:Peptidase M48 Ste24p n=1 Tax=Opitutus terrae (strain DSM 11246 / JCM 15787 / PB90-1) TaxID=452637 RepID=B1ZN11_OPITP|nr:M48 family metallopeptidase [Opitutus terrae]ACB76463.1 peptidase M48 Ste24p [Opitutus terrae PB90-1]
MTRKLAAILAACALLAGCYTVPETGRQAIILPIFDDVQMGAQAFADIRAKEKISTDPAANARIQRIGRRIAQAVGDRMPNAQWEFVVFDAPQTVNAFALPGGKVGVYTGLIDLASNDDEIAFVMGHEIAHVTSRHGAQRSTAAIGAAAGGILLDAATRDKQNHDLMLALYGVGAAGATLAYSRSHESEADFIGLRFVAYAGYDPRAAVTFWQKMAAKEKSGRVPELLSTHPSDERRIAALQAEMPNVLPIYEANKGRFQ